MRRKALIAGVIVCLGLMATLYYARSLATCESCGDFHRAIVDGTAQNPHRYRVLAPVLVQALFQSQTDTGVLVAYVGAHVVALPAMLGALYLYWRKWVSPLAALVGVVFVVAYAPIMFGVYGISLNNPLEVIFLCAGLLWLLSGRAGVGFAALVVVAAFNRETAVMLPLAFVALRWQDWRKPRVVAEAAVYFALWAAVFVGLRWALGPAPDQITVAQVFAANFGGGWNTSEAIINHLLIAPVWIAAVMGWKGAPERLKMLALVGVPYVALLSVFALWNETRLLLPLFALWMPLALRAFERLARSAAVQVATGD